MKLVFNEKMFRHINETAVKERGYASRALLLIEKALGYKVFSIPLWLLERVISFVIALPIPLYSTVMYWVVTNLRGLPHFPGMYLRALYYRQKIGNMESNVFIDQGVFFAHPKDVSLGEFSYIDKNVIIMSKSARIGRRVHIAPRVFVSGGGEFAIEDYACIATNSNIITSTEVIRDGNRCSGPMVSSYQRNVHRSFVRIMKDAFIGANVTILPGVTVAPGSVAGAGITLSKSTEPWGIYVGSKAQKIANRDPVLWPDD